MKLSLITADADAYAIAVPLTKDWKEIEIPLSSLQKDAFLYCRDRTQASCHLSLTRPEQERWI